MSIKLDLTIEEINTILRSLGKHPFDEIVVLISKIKQQGEIQLAEQQKLAAEQATAAEQAQSETPAE